MPGQSPVAARVREDGLSSRHGRYVAGAAGGVA